MWIVGLCACKIMVYQWFHSAEFEKCVYQVPWKWQMVKFVCRNNKKTTHLHTDIQSVCVYIHEFIYVKPVSQPANNSAIQNEPLSHGQTIYLCLCVHVNTIHIFGWNPKINRISNRWHGRNGIEGDMYKMCTYIDMFLAVQKNAFQMEKLACSHVFVCAYHVYMVKLQLHWNTHK